jgi:hypothetical protein
MQIFQLPHPEKELVLCDHACDLTADFLEVNEQGHESRVCVLHTHSAVHASRLPKRSMKEGLPFRSRPRD